MAEAAALAGWFGIATLLDEHGLRCIAAADGEIAIVTIRGLSMPEAMRVATGVRLLEDWSIARLCDLVQRACEAGCDEHVALH